MNDHTHKPDPDTNPVPKPDPNPAPGKKPDDPNYGDQDVNDPNHGVITAPTPKAVRDYAPEDDEQGKARKPGTSDVEHAARQVL